MTSNNTGRTVVAALVGAVLLVGSALQIASAQPYPADDTGKNVRDRQGRTVTAGDQSNNKGDVRITQNIRKAIVADKTLSINAHNVKIITKGGVVTLRGPVATAEEKDSIVEKTQHVAGVTRVDNQLEVASR